MRDCDNGNDGHRRRLKEKFRKSGKDALHSHELLELLLCYSIPRRDVKPAAKRLLSHFGSVQDVFNAGIGQLETVSGIGKNSALLIHLVNVLNEDIFSGCLKRKVQLKDPDEIFDFVRENYGNSEADGENLLFLLLDKSYMWRGTVAYPGNMHSLEADPGKLMVHLFNRPEIKFISVVHNHPTAVENASRTDAVNTIYIKSILKNIGMELCGHWVVTSERCFPVTDIAASDL